MCIRDRAKDAWQKLGKTNTHPAMRNIGTYFYLKDKDYQKALSLIKDESDKYSVFLRSQILLALKQPVEAMRNLVTICEDPAVVTNEGFMMFLLRSCKKTQH